MFLCNLTTIIIFFSKVNVKRKYELSKYGPTIGSKNKETHPRKLRIHILESISPKFR